MLWVLSLNFDLSFESVKFTYWWWAQGRSDRVQMAQDGDHRRTAGWPLEPPRMRSKGCGVLEPTPAVS